MQDVCVWCLRICTAPESYDPKQHRLVCNEVCRTNEMNFNMYYNDVRIGVWFKDKFGVNPNERGINAQGKQGAHKAPKDKA